MERAIFDIAELVAKSDNPIAALLWMAFVGSLILLPSIATSLLHFRYEKIFAPHITYLGFAPIFYLAGAPIIAPIFRHSFHLTSSPLLHIVALGLAAIWGWLEDLQNRKKGSKENVADINSKLARRDLLILTRLALWLTLSLMPTIKWS